MQFCTLSGSNNNVGILIQGHIHIMTLKISRSLFFSVLKSFFSSLFREWVGRAGSPDRYYYKIGGNGRNGFVAVCYHADKGLLYIA